MTVFSRRTVLQSIGLAGLMGVSLAGCSIVDHPSPDLLEVPGLVSVRERWVDLITGRQDLQLIPSHFTRLAIDAIDKRVSEYVAVLREVSDQRGPFLDLDIAVDTRMAIAYKRLNAMAVAWATPWSRFYTDKSVLDHILVGLKTCYTYAYNENADMTSSWYYWQIAIPQAITDILSIVIDYVDSDDRRNYLQALDHFVPDPKLLTDGAGKFAESDGANRVDICQAIIVRAVIGNDPIKLKLALHALGDVAAFTSDGSGFYRDGSFIQHDNIPYTGTYGIVALNGISKIAQLVIGTSYQLPDSLVNFLYVTTKQTFAPFIHDGQMFDSVRGRAISRPAEQSFASGSSAIEGFLRLSEVLETENSSQLRAICKGWWERNHYKDPRITGSVTRVLMIEALLEDSIVATAEELGGIYFPAMDRLVYRSRSWSLALSQCSPRIAWYETGGGENLEGFHTGSGMTYLYNTDQGSFDDGFWPTANPYRLPGTTSDQTKLVGPLVKLTHETLADSAWTGGCSTGALSVSGMHLFGPGSTGLQARKSIFVTPHYYVALGTGISSPSNATVESIVEHRNLGETGGDVISVDGKIHDGVMGGRVSYGKVRWAHLEGVAGYIFFEGEQINVIRESRTSSWSAINAGSDDQPLTREYATVFIDHGVRPIDANYAYAVLPMATPRKTQNMAAMKPVEVTRNDKIGQGIKTDSYSMTVFWATGTVNGISVDGPACVIFQKDGDMGTVTISDPTQKADSITIAISRIGFSQIMHNPRIIKHSFVNDVLKIIVDTKGLVGNSLTLQLS